MTLTPLLSAPFAVQLHVFCALCAVTFGPIVFLRRSRDHVHRALGYLWVVAMFATAMSSFWISDAPVIGPFSPIHALSVFTLYGLWQGVSAARARDIRAHQGHMRSLYFWAMGIAGMFTFLPGRRMNAVFGDVDATYVFGVAAVLILFGLLVFSWVEKREAI